MPPRLTAFYARLTREDAASASIENQTAGFEDLRRRHGWTAQHFVEQGRRASGEWTPAQRPALYQLLEAVERGEVERVVVRHLDRLGRGPILLQILDQLGEHGIDLWTFAGPEEYRTAAGELGTGVQALVGRFEVRRTGERIRASRRGHWLKGLHIGVAPYGYTSQARVRGELTAGGMDPTDAQVQAQAMVPRAPGLVIDPAEAEVVAEVVALYLDGLGARAIATRLTARGLTKRGNRWTSQAILKVLRDPKIAGLAHFDEEAYQGRTRRSQRPKHRQTLAPAAHPAIIDLVMWERVQLLLDSRGRQVAGSRGRARLYPLTGVLHCAGGHLMKGTSSGHASTAGEEWAYYACSARAHRGTDPAAGGCPAPRIQAARAERLVMEAIGGVLSGPERVVQVYEAARRHLAEAAPVNRAAEVRFTAEIRALEAQREGVMAAFRNPALTAEAQSTALGEVQRINAQIGDLDTARRSAAALAEPVAAPELPVARVREFLANLAERLPHDPQRQREFFEILRRHHALRLVAVTPSEVGVSLSLSSSAVAGRGPDIPLLVQASASDGPHSSEAWAEGQQGRHLCACGCGQAITVTPIMRAPTKGIPRFIRGHHPMRAAVEVQALGAAGLITLAQVARELGMGASTLSRAVKRGVVSPTGSGWRGMLAFHRVDLPAIRAALVADGHRFADGPLMTTPEMAAAIGIPPRALADLAAHLAGHLAEQGITIERDSHGRWIWPRAHIQQVLATLRRTVRKYRDV